MSKPRKPALAAAFALVVLITSLALPAHASERKPVKTRLTELFGLCKAGDSDAAAGYFVYRGPDESRKWKDTYRAEDAAERAEVKDACARIKSYLDESQGYTFGPVRVERESEGQWRIVEVSFRQGEETRRVLFAFLPVKGQFSIGDID